MSGWDTYWAAQREDIAYRLAVATREKWQHAAAAWSLLRRAQDANATQGTQLCELAAHRLRQAGALCLAEQIDYMLESWFANDDQMLQWLTDRAAEYAAQCETECLTGEKTDA